MVPVLHGPTELLISQPETKRQTSQPPSSSRYFVNPSFIHFTNITTLYQNAEIPYAAVVAIIL